MKSSGRNNNGRLFSGRPRATLEKVDEMNQESLNPLRKNHRSEPGDYPIINPYRWVRFGIILLLLAFVLLLPLVAILAF